MRTNHQPSVPRIALAGFHCRRHKLTKSRCNTLRSIEILFFFYFFSPVGARLSIATSTGIPSIQILARKSCPSLRSIPLVADCVEQFPGESSSIARLQTSELPVQLTIWRGRGESMKYRTLWPTAGSSLPTIVRDMISAPAAARAARSPQCSDLPAHGGVFQ